MTSIISLTDYALHATLTTGPLLILPSIFTVAVRETYLQYAAQPDFSWPASASG